jgi:uncharacterized membrane-anchored protein YjiN (DUF445 family)
LKFYKFLKKSIHLKIEIKIQPIKLPITSMSSKKESITSKIKKAQKQNDWKRASNLKRELKEKQTKNEMIQSVKKNLSKVVLEDDNKGFQMLKKMGFKIGQGLGKDESGMKTPIKINLNSLENKNQGIGIESEKQNEISKEIEKLEEYTEEEYRERMKEKYKNSKFSEDDLNEEEEEEYNYEEELKNYDFDILKLK